MLSLLSRVAQQVAHHANPSIDEMLATETRKKQRYMRACLMFVQTY
jgi:hypothetical protein